jgi:hypothetical protein
MKKIFTTLIFIIVFLYGCITVRNVRYESVIRDPKSQDYPIEIFESKDLERDYKVIGIVEASFAGKVKNLNKIADKLRQEARKMGGDALIDLTKKHDENKTIIATDIGKTTIGSAYSNINDIWTAKVIIWK